MYGQVIGLLMNIILAVVMGFVISGFEKMVFNIPLSETQYQFYSISAFGSILTYHFCHASSPYNIAQTKITMDIMQQVWICALQLCIFLLLTIFSGANRFEYTLVFVAYAKVISAAIVGFVVLLI